MFNQENKILSILNSAGAFLIMIGIIVAGLELHSLSYYKKAPIDINDVYDWRDLEVGSHVEFEASYVWDYAYSNVSSHKVVGVTVDQNETSRVYLLPSFYYSTSDNEYYIDSFIGLESHDFRVLDNMVYELDDWYRAHQLGTAFPQDYCKTTYKFDGRIRKASKQEYQLMVDYFVSGGMSEAEAKEMVLPVIIVRLNYSSKGLVAGIALLVIGAIVLVATIISGKKEAADYAAFARSKDYGLANNAGASSDNAPQYYGPEGLSSEVKAERTYQYGGTNTYGTNNVYSSSYQGNGTQVDEESGLSSEFLERMAREKEDREREEANQRAMEANAAAYAANPLFGNEPAAKPMTASQSFSAYDSVVDKSTLNQNPTNNSGLAVDPSILYGTTPAQPSAPVSPVAPAYEIPQPVYEAPQPAYEIPQPVYEAPQPAYEIPQPTYEVPQPTYDSQPAYEAPTQFSYQQTPSQYQYNQNPFLGASQQPYQAAQPTQPVQLPTGGSVAPQALAPSSSPVTLPSGNGIYSTSGNGDTTL